VLDQFLIQPSGELAICLPQSRESTPFESSYNGSRLNLTAGKVFLKSIERQSPFFVPGISDRSFGVFRGGVGSLDLNSRSPALSFFVHRFRLESFFPSTPQTLGPPRRDLCSADRANAGKIGPRSTGCPMGPRWDFGLKPQHGQCLHCSPIAVQIGFWRRPLGNDQAIWVAAGKSRVQIAH